MRCDGCMAVAYQLHLAFEKAHKNYKAETFRLRESEILDRTGERKQKQSALRTINSRFAEMCLTAEVLVYLTQKACLSLSKAFPETNAKSAAAAVETTLLSSSLRMQTEALLHHLAIKENC